MVYRKKMIVFFILNLIVLFAIFVNRSYFGYRKLRYIDSVEAPMRIMLELIMLELKKGEFCLAEQDIALLQQAWLHIENDDDFSMMGDILKIRNDTAWSKNSSVGKNCED